MTTAIHDEGNFARNGRFWLVLVAYLAAALLALGIPVDPFGIASSAGPVMLLVGAIGGVVFKRRNGTVSRAFSWGFFIAGGIGLLWLITHIKVVLP